MKKIFFLIIIFSSVCFSKNVSFSLLISGDNFGKYKMLPEKYNYIRDISKKRKNLYKINVGNNYSLEYTEVNTIFQDFYKELKFDFNLLGRREYITGDYQNRISLNVFDKEVIPYKIINHQNFNIVLTGLSNGYTRKGDNLLDYEDELTKFLYKVRENSDIIIIISDLRREENIQILEEYEDISLLIESGYENINNEILEINYKYLIPAEDFVLADFIFNKESNKIPAKRKENYSIKKVFLEKYSRLTDYKEIQPNPDLSLKVKNLTEKISNINSEIVGYNNKTFYKSMVSIDDNISFLDNIGKSLMVNYNVDRVVFFYDSVLNDLEAGMYSRDDLKDVFNVDEMIMVRLKKSDYVKLNELAYIYGEDFSEIEDEVTILTTETIFKHLPESNLLDIKYINENTKSFIMGYLDEY